MICSNRVGGAKLLQANGEQLWKCFSPYSIIVSRGAQGLRGSFGQWCIMKQFPRPDSVTYTSARILTKTPLSRNGGEDFFREVLTAYEYVSKWEQAWCSAVLTQSSTEDGDDGNHKDGKRCYSLAGITPTIDMYKKTLNLLGQLRPTIAFLPWKLGDFLLAQRRRLLLGPLKVGYTVLIYVSSCSIGVRYLHPGVFFFVSHLWIAETSQILSAGSRSRRWEEVIVCRWNGDAFILLSFEALLGEYDPNWRAWNNA